MATLRLIVILAALFTVTNASSNAELSPEVLDYTTSLILHNFEQTSETSDCWFYESRSTRGLLNPILSSAKLSSIPKLLFLDIGAVTAARSPSMLVLVSDNFRNVDLFSFLRDSLSNPYTRVVVLYSTTAQYNDAVVLFKAAFLHNVIFILTSCLLIRYSETFKNEHHEKRGFVPFGDVFVDQASDLGGYVVKLSTAHYYCEIVDHEASEDIFRWVSEAIVRMNGSYRYYPIVCDVYEECSGKAYFYNDSTWYDFCLDDYLAGHISPNWVLPSVVPSVVGIVAPRGRKLTVFEAFVAPFKYQLWIALLLLLVFCYCLMLFNVVQNDLILLALCDFERRNLRRVSPAEKLATISLVILFFLLKCSYESKLISFMTSVSHVADPHTLDDLISANITIRHISLKETNLRESDDSRLKLVFVQDVHHNTIGNGYEWDPTDKTKAYFGEIHRMSSAIHHPSLLDSKSRRSHYIILAGFTGLTITVRPIQYRSPLGSRFTWYERAYFEAGLLHVTTDRITHASYGLMHQNMINDKKASANTVGIKELAPAWYALVIGWSVAGFVLTVEMCEISKKLSSFLGKCTRKYYLN